MTEAQTLSPETQVTECSNVPAPIHEPPVAYLFGSSRPLPLVSGATYSLGRDPKCTIPVDSKNISRQHARLRVSTYGRVELMDLHSTNGTYVRDERLAPETPRVLGDGTCFRIGSRLFWVVLGPGAKANDGSSSRLPRLSALSGGQPRPGSGSVTARDPLEPIGLQTVMTTRAVQPLSSEPPTRDDLPPFITQDETMSGPLSAFAVPVLLQHLHVTGQTGDLELIAAGQRYRIHLEVGRLVFAHGMQGASEGFQFSDLPALKGSAAVLAAANLHAGSFRFHRSKAAPGAWNVTAPTSTLLFESCWAIDKQAALLIGRVA